MAKSSNHLACSVLGVIVSYEVKGITYWKWAKKEAEVGLHCTWKGCEGTPIRSSLQDALMNAE